MNALGMRWLLAGIGIGLILYGLSGPRMTGPLDAQLARIAEMKPEAFMEGVHQRIYDEQGRLETTLIADSFLDFGERADAELEKPRLWLERPPASWYLEGMNGTLSADRKRVTLNQEVVAVREEPNTAPWELSNDTLTWDQNTDLVTSNSKTTLTQGATQSVGDSLLMNLQSSEYTLGDKVKTQWQSTSSSQSR